MKTSEPSHSQQNLVYCSEAACESNHPCGKWGDIKALNDGWFAMQNGTVFCPDHVPEWVAGWRAKRAPR